VVLGWCGACGAPEVEPEAFLIVKVAQEQLPSGKAVNVIVQSRGGRSLLLRTEGGTHRLAQLGRRRVTSCIATSSDPLIFAVHPDGDSCVLLVDLQREPPQGTQDPDSMLACVSPIVRSTTLLVPAGTTPGAAGSGPVPGPTVTVSVSGTTPEGAAGKGND
jgi:hypothetical protein